ncbi:hypothetical protein, partial [Mesorhizobium japonicum]|uniref:hypothetical protein n=1 Tax=Mesorhizobium japonicum TaxID=2066070 RepID=UPI003B5A1C62
EQERSCFIDLKETPPATVVHPAPVSPTFYSPPVAEATSNLSINYILAALVAMLLVAFMWRFDWLLAEQAGLSVLVEDTGELTTFYT